MTSPPSGRQHRPEHQPRPKAASLPSPPTIPTRSPSGPRRGFTLIELLVVISMIAVLIALLLPAVQAAREAARRAHCLNNLKQLGIAIHQYHGLHGVIVPGRIVGGGKPDLGAGAINYGFQNTPWTAMLLPFLEQSPLASAYNFDLGAEGPGNLGFVAHVTVMATRIDAFQCPSDRSEPFRPPADFGASIPGGLALTRGNYAANWGNTNWAQNDVGVGHAADFLAAPFGSKGNIAFAAVTDGLSHTAFLAEIKQGRDSDIRGFLGSSLPGATSVMSRFAPNRGKDVAKDDYRQFEEDLASRPGLCVPEPGRGLDCHGDPLAFPDRSLSGSRSGHPGGLNLLRGDGSTRFVKDSVDPRLYVGLHTIAGNEAISGD